MLENSPVSWTERAASPCRLEAVGWTQEGQEERFAAVLKHLRPSGAARERVLDFGCGTGALYECVPIGCMYVGYDWSGGMVFRARREHPDADLFTSAWPPGRFECVAAIGTFNLPGSKQHTFHTLRHLWDTARCRVLVASLYAGTDDRCLIYTEKELEHLGRELSHDVTVERHRPNDLLLVARR